MPEPTHVTNRTVSQDNRLFPNDFTNVYDQEEKRRKREADAKKQLTAEEIEAQRRQKEADTQHEIERLKQQISQLEADKKVKHPGFL
ncbi:hypothetical protein TWF694_005570 [Orbilia ellipsospora]|uniref:Uncharacterized protein n=1 Tax=Orbilia ellipsospora TaxID=2528407 RepID=A0AAV9WVY5_9PEZI